jgi:hypothetical protein
MMVHVLVPFVLAGSSWKAGGPRRTSDRPALSTIRQTQASSAFAPERATFPHGGRKRLLHRVVCPFGIARYARRHACEDVEAAAVQRLELFQLRSSASSHISLTRRMRLFF